MNRILIGSVVVLLLGVVASSIGPVNIPPPTMLNIIANKIPMIDIAQNWPESWDIIVWQIRLPRIVLAGMVGAALSMSGATYQGLFRNPLADPYLLGVASGAGLGATIMIVTGTTQNYYGFSLLPLAAFLGAVTAVSLSYLIAQNSGGLPLSTLILAGIAVASLASALTALIMLRGEPNLRDTLLWLWGGFSSAQWSHNVFMLPYLLLSTLIIIPYARIINTIQLDEDHAQQVGVNVNRTKYILIGTASLTTAAAVSFSGLIGFVGLIAPHCARLLWGVDYRSLLPSASILGAGFLIIADLAARTIINPSELPVGIVTACCGVPFFLYLLRRSGGRKI